MISDWTRHSVNSVRAKAASMGLGVIKDVETPRMCLGGCGRPFMSSLPKSLRRICESCAARHRAAA
jgi:hypothetical protein